MAVGRCILIADDHTGVRKALRLLLETNGFQVCGEAVNGLDVIEKAAELTPDLILLDLSMPVMNGLEAATKLRKLMPHVPVFLVTNHAGSIRDEEIRKVGIRAVIEKNDAPAKLMNSVREFLDKAS